MSCVQRLTGISTVTDVSVNTLVANFKVSCLLGCPPRLEAKDLLGPAWVPGGMASAHVWFSRACKTRWRHPVAVSDSVLSHLSTSGTST